MLTADMAASIAAGPPRRPLRRRIRSLRGGRRTAQAASARKCEGADLPDGAPLCLSCGEPCRVPVAVALYFRQRYRTPRGPPQSANGSESKPAGSVGGRASTVDLIRTYAQASSMRLVRAARSELEPRSSKRSRTWRCLGARMPPCGRASNTPSSPLACWSSHFSRGSALGVFFGPVGP